MMMMMNLCTVWSATATVQCIMWSMEDNAANDVALGGCSVGECDWHGVHGVWRCERDHWHLASLVAGKTEVVMRIEDANVIFPCISCNGRPITEIHRLSGA